MKNIFITACYEVDKMYSFGETNYLDYKQLTNLCTNSFLKNLKDPTEVRILEGQKEHFHELFKELYWEVQNIYFANQPCDILFVDSDTLCLKPIEIFGKWDKFAMFNSAEEHRLSYFNPICLQLVQNLKPWMMANIRYYPSGLPMSFWDVGDDLAYSWVNEWAYDAIIYNKMFHAQDIKNFDDFIQPHLNFQVDGIPEAISYETIRDASVLHCHATRGTKMAIAKMKRAQQITDTFK